MASGTAVLMLAAFGTLEYRKASNARQAEATVSERALVLAEMRRRMTDPWPRGTGHVPLGFPGMAELDKAYLEPGGSFSPSGGSFGVSIWVRDKNDRLVSTSDQIPLAQTRHRYVGDLDQDVGIETTTPYYKALWSMARNGTRNLSLVALQPDRFDLELVLRSVGPAGGRILRMEARKDNIRIDDRWTLAMPDSADIRAMGDEREGGLLTTSNASRTAGSADGWAFARIELGSTRSSTFSIRPHAPAPRPSGLTVPAPLPRLDISDATFRNALDAQVYTLLIGLVGEQTRPGEPVNYPLEWQRDGAYVVVALARAGQGEIARSLAMRFARQDFFGGMGSEADAPGLGLWTLAEVSAALDDPAFDRAIWPHVVRKAAWIRRLSTTPSPVRVPVHGPVVPANLSRDDLDLVADPARSGLIDGRMDFHRPVFFVNATAFAGLNEAARIAGRLGHDREEQAWHAEAAKLGKAWNDAFAFAAAHQPAGEKNFMQRVAGRARKLIGLPAPLPRIGSDDDWNDRTAVAGLWPSGVASTSRYRSLLEQRWQKSRNSNNAPAQAPLWTYFTIAEAHQWLRLGNPSRSWATLDHLWTLQPAPGLFTLWEGEGEENTFHQWEKVRGWLRPPNVTPHYWSAAEMLLLQLEMLAYADGGQVVIGPGLKGDWLKQPVTIGPIQTGRGWVSYRWDGSSVKVTLSKSLATSPVRLGTAFPAGTPVSVSVAGN